MTRQRIRTSMPFAVLTALALLAAACEPNLSLPAEALLTCDDSAQCPSSRRCVAGLCRAAGDVCTQGTLESLALQDDGAGCTRAGGEAGLCRQGECVAPRCGDGFVSEGEACDSGALNARDPDAPCRPDCTLPRCGDAVLDSGEECEPDLSAPLPCQSFGPGFHAGEAPCSAACEYDASSCERCGDGVVNGDEICDGADPVGISCLGLGFDAGRIGCNPLSCEADTAACVRWGWTQVETTVREDLNDLAGTRDGSLLYAVGNGGVILRRADGDWKRIDSPTAADLRRVVVASASPEIAWAAGAEGTLVKLTGAGAQLVPGPEVEPDTDLDFLSLAPCSPEHVLVATSQGLFEYDGGWTAIDIEGAIGTQYAGFVSDVVCIAGETWLLVRSYFGNTSGRLYVERDSAWLPEGGMAVCDDPASLDVVDDRMAIGCVGSRPPQAQVALYRFDSSALQLEPNGAVSTFISALPEVRWSSDDVLWMYGGNGLLGSVSEQGGWFQEALDLPLDLRAGWSGPDRRLSFAVGAGGSMLTSTGYGRHVFETPTDGEFQYKGSRGGCVREGGELVVVGPGKLLRRSLAQTWEVLAEAPEGTRLNALHCEPSSAVVCAAGMEGYVGCTDPATGELTTLRSAATGGPDADLADVWRAPDGVLFVADPYSDPSTVWRREVDGTWSNLELAAPEGLTPQAGLLDGTSSNEVYTLDRWNGLLHYSGGAGFELTPITGEVWEAVAMTTADLWVGPDATGRTVAVVTSSNGTVFVLRDGELTTQQFGRLLTSSYPVGLWGARFEDLFLAQTHGDAYHFDGELWSPVRFEPLQGQWAITGQEGDSIYVAGTGHDGTGTVVQVRYPRPIGER